MPELPEVETVRRQLEETLLGTTFVSVERIEPSMLRDCSAADLVGMLPGRKVEAVERLGKFLVVRLDEDLFLTLHLGMTGQLLFEPDGESKHTRFHFQVQRGDLGEKRLEFRDMRKFGKVHMTVGAAAPRLTRLGPDAWRGEWDAAYLAERARGRTVAIKAFLLDQGHVAGIGNIYADEILWWTGISPLRPAGSLVPDEVERLAQEIRHRLGEGVKFLGCSFSDFVDTLGQEGGFQEWLQAYGKSGRVCGRCGGIFERTVVAGRGTSYCPLCQK